MSYVKKVLVLGGGGFIGGHLAKKLKTDGAFVRIADIKSHEYFDHAEISNEFIHADLRDPKAVESVVGENFDEIYQLAADMGGAGYIFTGENDANVMHNSAMINLNVAHEATKKRVKKLFYSSSACMYPEYNQLDSNNPNCEESSAYPANPDSEYGWEKLFSERLYFAFARNYSLNIRVARFHNIYGPQGTWEGGKEKAPAAMLRKVAEAKDGESIEVWGDGLQTRSFLYIDECVSAVQRLMKSDFVGPVNIGSEEMVSINELAKMAIQVSQKNITVQNISGEAFKLKYGFECPVGVKGRNSNNRLFEQKVGSKIEYNLYEGMQKTFEWIKHQVEKKNH